MAKLPDLPDDTAATAWLRRRYAVLLAYAFMGRQDSCISLLTADHGLDDDFLWLRLTEKQKRSSSFRRVVRIPTRPSTAHGHQSVIPHLAHVARQFIARSTALRCRRRCSHFFQLPGERPPVTADMSDWLSRTLTEVGIAAPPGFAYLGHSLRSGASSTAEAIGVSRYRGNWLGGWAQTGNTREAHYMDPSFQPTPAAFAWFGWLLSGDFDALPPERH
ncbi:hypothetical protein AB1Y20_001233 [Prymnesium parvum]|uniref:Tyr recombinase domain-containing protein n=1 Tax=Prymnesium parvum TaxID=97485 RepID=A0AB34K735_PRYPA